MVGSATVKGLRRTTRLLLPIASVALLGVGTAGCGGASPAAEPPTAGAAGAPAAGTSGGSSTTETELRDLPDAPAESGEPDPLSDGSGAGAGPGGAVPAGARCTLAELKADRGRTTGEAGQRHTVIVWTNTSARTCTMTGFGGIDLQGPPDPKGPTYSLPRAGRTAAAVRLVPGGTAHTTITWLPPQEGPGWTPTRLSITPPDETRSATVSWPGGAVLRQDGATHPGTYFDPVAPGPEG